MHGLPVTHLLPAGLVHSSTAAAAVRSAVEARVSANSSADSSADSSAADNNSAQPGRLDPMVMLCPFELDGKCNDYECAYQHLQGGRRAAPLCAPLPKLQLPGYSATTGTSAGASAGQQQQQQQAGNDSAAAAGSQAAAAGSVHVPSKAKRTRDAAAAASSDSSGASAAQRESQQQQQQQPRKRRKATGSPPTTSPAVTAAVDVGFVDGPDDAEQQHLHDDTSTTSSSAEAESVAAWLAQYAAKASSMHSGHRATAAAAHPYAAFTSDSDNDSSAAALQELSDKQQAALKKHLAAEPGDCAAWMLLALHKLPCPAPRSSTTSSSTKLSSSSSNDQSRVLLAADRLYYLEKLLRRNSRQQHKASSSSSSGGGTGSLKHALVVLSNALTHVPNRLHSGLWMLYLKLYALHGSKLTSLTEHAFAKLPLCLPLWQFARIHGAAAAASSADGAVVAVSDVAALCVKRLQDLCVLLERQREQADGSALDSFSAHKMLVYVLLDRTQLLVSALS
jgi:Putative zinc-finger domain